MLGTLIKSPFNDSMGYVIRICDPEKHNGALVVEVQIDEDHARGHHKKNDIVIWVVR